MDLKQADAAVAPTPVAAPLSQAAASRKLERLAHREFLYSVVRDAMIRAGVLAASYKFKVLSLDARGRQYLIMMDVVQPLVDDMANLSEIETSMIQAAKARHDLLVAAVYWRANEQLASGRATSSLTPAGVSAVPAQPVTAGRQHLAPADEFQDTQIVPADEHASPMGMTQYGELK